eukprot:scaffold140_cov247-Pinguiococcus_pyrenoidosus.AAC.27
MVVVRASFACFIFPDEKSAFSSYRFSWVSVWDCERGTLWEHHIPSTPTVVGEASLAIPGRRRVSQQRS